MGGACGSSRNESTSGSVGAFQNKKTRVTQRPISSTGPSVPGPSRAVQNEKKGVGRGFVPSTSKSISGSVRAVGNEDVGASHTSGPSVNGSVSDISRTVRTKEIGIGQHSYSSTSKSVGHESGPSTSGSVSGTVRTIQNKVRSAPGTSAGGSVSRSVQTVPTELGYVSTAMTVAPRTRSAAKKGNRKKNLPDVDVQKCEPLKSVVANAESEFVLPQLAINLPTTFTELAQYSALLEDDMETRSGKRTPKRYSAQISAGMYVCSLYESSCSMGLYLGMGEGLMALGLLQKKVRLIFLAIFLNERTNFATF